MMTIDTLKQRPNRRGMASEVVRSKQVRGDSRNQQVKEPAKRKKWKSREGMWGKWKGRRRFAHT